jgi:pectate lyase
MMTIHHPQRLDERRASSKSNGSHRFPRLLALASFGFAFCLEATLFPEAASRKGWQAPARTPRLLPLAPAFPEAQGGGAYSVGGRGGTVYEVTNLNDSGPGSLRACINASGPRTCVFRVAGTINLTSGPLDVWNPYLTVAGQTAPGGGIEITAKNSSDSILKIYANDVIWRYTRLRVGYTANRPKDGFVIAGSAHDVIFDHNSETWTTNENVAVWGRLASQYNVTWSWNIIAEPLANHPINMLTGADTHALADGMTDLDAHHNLLMNVSHRNPLWKHKSGRWVNNIIYNWAFRATQLGGGIWADLIGNLYKPGPLTPTRIHEVDVYQHYAGNTTTADGDPSIYIASNQGPSSGPVADNWNMVFEAAKENGKEIGQLPLHFRRSSPLPAAGVAILVNRVTELEDLMLPTVGASQRLDCNGTWVTNRDSVDLRLIKEYGEGKGIVPKTEDEVGGFPVIAPSAPCTDSDHDGIPDVWETAHGLNPNDASDGALVAANGFTNLENYLNGSPSSSARSAAPQAPSGLHDEKGPLKISRPLFGDALWFGALAVQVLLGCFLVLPFGAPGNVAAAWSQRDRDFG